MGRVPSILIVDDDELYVESLGDALRHHGHQVVAARSGGQALDLLSSVRVDCILLDRRMPGLSGPETCMRIKSSPAWRDIPLIMLTASDDRASMIEGMDAGADDYVAKSADLDLLMARLRAQLRRRSFEDEQRQLHEQQVRKETEARFQRLIHSNIIGVVLLDVDGRLVEANQAFLAMLQRPREQLIAGELYWRALTPTTRRASDEELFGRLRRGETVTPFETDLVRLDATPIAVLVGFVTLEGTDTLVGFVVDRTEQRSAQRKLESYAHALEDSNRQLLIAKELAEQESRFKSRFLAGMSHELRTPLNAIIGFSDLLAEESFGPLTIRQKEFVDHVLASGRHLLSLVNDVLDLAKVQAGRMELAREWTGLQPLVDSVEGVVRTLAEKRGVALSVDMARDLPDVYLDVLRVKQVLYNLLSNAIKFTPSGGRVTLHAEVDGGRVLVECEDTGIGIHRDDLPRLFREFEQIEPTIGDKPAGTGLGLALTRHLVEMHGGTITVQSEPGHGSRFTIMIPIPRRPVAGPMERA